jgi:hypothetical protein
VTFTDDDELVTLSDSLKVSSPVLSPRDRETPIRETQPALKWVRGWIASEPFSTRIGAIYRSKVR